MQSSYPRESIIKYLQSLVSYHISNKPFLGLHHFFHMNKCKQLMINTNINLRPLVIFFLQTEAKHTGRNDT